jgi:hypothetical protein
MCSQSITKIALLHRQFSDISLKMHKIKSEPLTAVIEKQHSD